jgi:hypothetical protein
MEPDIIQDKIKEDLGEHQYQCSPSANVSLDAFKELTQIMTGAFDKVFGEHDDRN